MAIMSQEEADAVVENMLALALLTGYVRKHHGTIRLSCSVEEIAAAVSPDLAARATDLAERRECTQVVVEITEERVQAFFEPPATAESPEETIPDL